MSHPAHANPRPYCSACLATNYTPTHRVVWVNNHTGAALCQYHFDQLRGDVPPYRTGFRPWRP